MASCTRAGLGSHVTEGLATCGDYFVQPAGRNGGWLSVAALERKRIPGDGAGAVRGNEETQGRFR